MDKSGKFSVLLLNLKSQGTEWCSACRRLSTAGSKHLSDKGSETEPRCWAARLLDAGRGSPPQRATHTLPKLRCWSGATAEPCFRMPAPRPVLWGSSPVLAPGNDPLEWCSEGGSRSSTRMDLLEAQGGGWGSSLRPLCCPHLHTRPKLLLRLPLGSRCSERSGPGI